MDAETPILPSSSQDGEEESWRGAAAGALPASSAAAEAPPPAPVYDPLARRSSPSPSVPVSPPPISLANNNGKTPNLLLDDPIREQQQLYYGLGRAADSRSDGRDMLLSDQDGDVDSGEPQMHKDGGIGKRQQCKNLVVERKRRKKLNDSSLVPNITKVSQVQMGEGELHTEKTHPDYRNDPAKPRSKKSRNSKTCMMEAARSCSWSDLQPELLGLVLRRLPSLADRVHLRAVCRPWRSDSMLPPLPLPFPWLTLPDGTFLSIPAGEIHRIPVPDGACVQGSVDNWLFLVHKSSMHKDNVCSLMNPFSKTMLELPDLVTVCRKPVFYKLVVPSPLDSSPDSPVAALITEEGNCHTLCISQPPIATVSLGDNNDPRLRLSDVVFFNKKLYPLGKTGSGQLYIIDLGNDLGISSSECIIDSGRYRWNTSTLFRNVLYVKRVSC
ncbi:hypothetical protein ACQ4PT_063366 [Festuca glaucescens]